MKFKSSFLNEASTRGFLYQFTNLEEMDEYLSSGIGCGYVGFDITAKSLHIGSFIPISLLRLFQKHGHKPIVLVGGGTSKIGDPSFRNTARPLLTNEQISENMVGIKACLKPFLKFGDGESDAVMVDNADWLDKLEYIPFLRETGKYFSINRMIGFDSVKSKLTENNSLSFLEFNYMVLQAHDFCELYQKRGCRIQFGGQDQWGNIVCGVELARKKLGLEIFGCTCPLLTTSDGKKMGKTATGAVWLLPEMYSAYDFWQYWRNIDDTDVIKMMYLFSDTPLDEIKKMESLQGHELNEIKKLLANEVTARVHGHHSLEAIHRSAAGLFDKNSQDFASMTSVPKYELNAAEIETTSLVDILVNAGMCESRGDAKRLLRGNGVQVNDSIIDENYKISPDSFASGFIKLSCGKKKHLLIVWKA
ncbi:MAG: tyrosine--tRNA ligase [Holosporaceae bacterium]|jgi:tyrosyl-tRNA synthetase|nr:tyrosine--tRNA ligase [Holosporaceae bacterium]